MSNTYYGAGLKYDYLHKSKNYTKETEYIINCFTKFKPNTHSILDIGCGSGSHSSLLHLKGYNQLGIDPCPTMIKLAKTKPGNFKCTSLSNIEDKFDASISMFSVINHINNLKDLSKFFNDINTILKDEGLLIFDCFNNIAFNKDNPKKIKQDNYTITPEFNKFDATLNLLSKSNIPELNYKINQRIWSVDILKELLNKYFKSIFIFNNLSFTPANENNYKITFICQK